MGRSTKQPDPTYETHVVVGDLHIPFQDTKAVVLLLDFIQMLRPTGVHLIGDILDCDVIGRFVSPSDRRSRLQEDFDLGYDFLKALRNLVPHAKIIYSEGNHEVRLQKYLMGKAPELESLRDLSVGRQLRLSDLDIRWKKYGRPYPLGNLLLVHGHVVRKHSATTAHAMVDAMGKSVLHGHTHRLGMYYTTTHSGMHIGIENGCLCRSDLQYLDYTPNWQLGWSVVTVGPSKATHVEQVLVNPDYTFWWRGKLYP